MQESKASVRTIFNAAVEMEDPALRAEYLCQACGSDDGLRNKIEDLIGANHEAGGFLGTQGEFSRPTMIIPANQPPAAPRDRIGPYKLLQQIGEGGCGVVYLAEQEHPIRRRVALKIIKPGMDTKSVIARFEAERQALALMDHPNIAKVLDAGSTETGRPFFVMELVKGIRITEYCDQQNLTAKSRLELFAQVCMAIQHAHQKGVIHRDIKPSNILVTVYDGAAVPKVIDFGIAKATQQPLTEKTLFTALDQFIGTPAYMSPEQAVLSAVDVDTRSDIYSLGVLLYELLTGRPPFEARDLVKAGLDEIRRIIREEEPAKPSTRLSTLVSPDLMEVAKRRHSDPQSLARFIRGDLDWIAMKALEKDRSRRYETAESLALEIKRFLNNEPVMAGPPGGFYRLSKMVRRHKFLVSIAGTVLATWLVFTLFTLIKVVPVLAENYKTFGAKLPMFMEWAIFLSDWLRKWFVLIVLAPISMVALGVIWGRRKQ